MKTHLLILFLIIGKISIYANIIPPQFIHITNKDGLSSSYVKGIKQDKYGFIWVVTRENITRFEGNQFTKFPIYNHLGNITDVKPQNLIYLQDSLLLLESMQNYIYYYDYSEECFRPYIPLFNSLKKENITYIPSEEILFLQDNSIYSYDLNLKKITASTIFNDIDKLSPKEKFYKIDANENIIATYTSNNRVIIKNFKTHKAKVINDINPNKSDDLYFVKVDSNNNIWLGFYSTGLFKIDSKNGKITTLNKTTKNTLPHNMIHCLTFDKNGKAWIGTENGLCIWDEANDEFKTLRYDRRNPDGLNTNPIYNAFTDRDGNIWLGTYFGGINFWSNYKSKFKFWQPGNTDNHLGGKVVSCFTEDKNKNIWIGTEDMGVNKLNLKSGKIEKITESLKNANLSYENVHDLLFVKDDELWIATYSGGINILNLNTKQLKYINTNTNPELGSDYIYKLTQKDNIIYIGTNSGLTSYNIQTQKFTPLFKDQIKNQSIVSFTWRNDTLWMCSYESVYSYYPPDRKLTKETKLIEDYTFAQIFVTSLNEIWLTTNNNGLLRYYPDTKNYDIYSKETGFPTNRIFAIEEDVNHSIWVTTNIGLINFFPNENKFIHYDSNSGVPFNQFNYRASYKNSDGILFFGGNEGMVSIDPTRDEKSIIPSVRITDFLLFNKHIQPGKESPLKKSILEQPDIILEYDQNVLTFNFSALNYANRGKTSYAYKMDGFEDNFNIINNRNSATYTNLDPGKYTFIVKASNDAWITESLPQKIHIKIKAPLYLTPPALLSYLLLFIIVILVLNRISLRIHKAKAALNVEKQERLNDYKINNFKLNFFTNISHEIKTPLSLILGPLTNLLDKESFNSDTKKTLQGIYINVSRLNNLLGELLDFRKIEDESINFYVSKYTNLDFISNIENAFIPIANNSRIQFTANFKSNLDELWLNKAIIEKITFNLLSNSFKYCKAEDSVSLNIFTDQDSKEINLIVTDNGPGIPKSDIDNVFNKYYQTKDAKKLNIGTGIGLNYVYNLVKLHHGTINVNSDEQSGTLFSIHIPCGKSAYQEKEIKEENKLYNLDTEIITNKNFAPKINSVNKVLETIKNKPAILIVEDNQELIDFLVSFLKDKYAVRTAKNGIEALDKIQSEQPELIISDIMMPQMDGLELTNRIKSNIETSHIPIILLTAKSGIENQYEGLINGADNYLEKPFVPQILEQQIINIIQTRRQSIITFTKEDYSKLPGIISTSEKDKEFIETITQIIENNIDNASLDVKFIVDQMRLSRSLIHIKLKSLLNCSTTEYIRIIRLKKAINLIKYEHNNYTEAAYKTGFTSLTYFSRAFKEQYGVSPRNYFTKK